MADNFEKLECWKKCFELKLFIKEKVILALPDSEKFDLRSQILRASRSATANIAEGWGRYHYKENVKFLLNARGSVAEVLDHALEAHSWNYITKENLAEIRNTTDSCIRLLNGYIKYLRKQNE
ncbi:four helix bundle protein [Salinimicrobium sediminis]|uniref:Four helix bundle protein n=1 Tax=Salinimicrobium sediminis TaxID=1343891 RepID=A0A285X4W3_9FLAO|nr:four helix bundle protein [Salinimicrobium sediminis]SOC80355.1 four helix bundle protein [Salinimicrobium sediminis]